LHPTITAARYLEEWHEHALSPTNVSSCLKLENHSAVCSPHMALLLKAMHFWCSFQNFETKLNGKKCFFFKLTTITKKSEHSHPKAEDLLLPC
jgi:hypothetical protein